MINIILNIIIGGFASSYITVRVCEVFDINLIVGVFFLILLAVIFYLFSARLMYHYLESKAPGIMDVEEQLPSGEHLWEMTAGTGIVPRWVSVVGLASYSFTFGAILNFTVLLMK